MMTGIHLLTPSTLCERLSVTDLRADITLQDQVDAVVAAINAITGQVAPVGQTGGAAISHAAVDAAPDSVSRVIYVESGTLELSLVNLPTSSRGIRCVDRATRWLTFRYAQRGVRVSCLG